MFDKAFYTARWLNMMKNSVSQPAAKSGFVDDLKREIRKGGWAATYVANTGKLWGQKDQDDAGLQAAAVFTSLMDSSTEENQAITREMLRFQNQANDGTTDLLIPYLGNRIMVLF